MCAYIGQLTFVVFTAKSHTNLTRGVNKNNTYMITLGTFDDCVNVYHTSGYSSPEEEQSLAEGLRRVTRVSDCLEFARKARGDAHRVRIYRRAQALAKTAYEASWIYDEIIGSPRGELLPLALESLQDALARAKDMTDETDRLHALLQIGATIRTKPHGRGDQYLHEVLTLALALAPAPEVAADTSAS